MTITKLCNIFCLIFCFLTMLSSMSLTLFLTSVDYSLCHSIENCTHELIFNDTKHYNYLVNNKYRCEESCENITCPINNTMCNITHEILLKCRYTGFSLLFDCVNPLLFITIPLTYFFLISSLFSLMILFSKEPTRRNGLYVNMDQYEYNRALYEEIP